jgi:type III pantothenate kinase
MLLAVDIGNADVVLGLFEGGRLERHWRLSADTARTADEYGVFVRSLFQAADVPSRAVQSVALASVVPPLVATWEAVTLREFGRPPFVYGADGRFGIDVRVAAPVAEVGSRILLNALAARALVGAPVIAVDFGTATTVDVVAQDGAYIGSAIAPGILTGAEALVERTAKLPRVELLRPARVIGTTTVEAMQAGIVLGAAGQVEALVRRAREEIGAPSAPVVATGALADLMAAVCPAIDRVEPWLTLFGLARVARQRADGDGTREREGENA